MSGSQQYLYRFILQIILIAAFGNISLFFRSAFGKTATNVCENSSCEERKTHVAPSGTVSQSYDVLKGMCEDISSLSEVLVILGWDEHVMMPEGSAQSRGKQKAVLTSLIHEKVTSNEFQAAIENAKKDLDNLDEFERAVVRDAERNYEQSIRVPGELEREIVQHETECLQAWVTARKTNDYSGFAPSLEKMMQLSKEKALAINPGTPVFDTRIDMFERGMTSKRLKSIFDQIESPLKVILKRTLEAKSKSTKKVHPALLGDDEWTLARQQALSKEVATSIGYDFNKGRLDVSVHPFAAVGIPNDVRITTRYSKEAPFEGVMKAMHEAGHAIYEQGRNEKYANLLVSEAVSTGVHESQSLFWERMVGQNKNFWTAMLPKVHEHLPHTREQGVTGNDLFFAVNQVNPGLIRVEADELTYPFHVMLRFDLERRLLEGDLTVQDLPQAWNTLMKEYLDVDVPNDTKGCLQDVHWSMGAIGYFPSYSLGAMMAAQLFQYMKASVFPDIDERIAKSDFIPIKLWLNKHIHKKGSLFPSLDELLLNVTGEVLNPNYFIKYLDTKYAQMYS